MSVNYQREGGLPGKASRRLTFLLAETWLQRLREFIQYQENRQKNATGTLHLHFVFLEYYSFNMTTLIVFWLRQLRLPEGNSETQWPHHQLQTQSSRSSGNSALALASVPGMALFTMWIWWHCPRGDDSKLGQGQGTVVPPTKAPISSGEGETVIPTACRDTTRSSTQKKTRHQQQRQLIKGREEACLSK